MAFLFSILLAILCFLLPFYYYRRGKVRRLTVIFWFFFGLSAFLNGTYFHFFYHHHANQWSGLLVPLLVQVPFAVMIYFLEIKNRHPLYAVFMAFLGSFLMTGLWLMTTAFFGS